MAIFNSAVQEEALSEVDPVLTLMDPVAVRPDGPLVFDREIKGEICSDHFLHVQKRAGPGGLAWIGNGIC